MVISKAELIQMAFTTVKERQKSKQNVYDTSHQMIDRITLSRKSAASLLNYLSRK